MATPMTDDEIVNTLATWQTTAQIGDEMTISAYVKAGSKYYRGLDAGEQKRINIHVKMNANEDN